MWATAYIQSVLIKSIQKIVDANSGNQESADTRKMQKVLTDFKAMGSQKSKITKIMGVVYMTLSVSHNRS